MAEPLARVYKVCLWVTGALFELTRVGLVRREDTDRWVMTPRAVCLFDQLAASGFRPTKTEIRESLAAMYELSKYQVNRELVDLVYGYRKAVEGMDPPDLS